jgi:hypothetical protein
MSCNNPERAMASPLVNLFTAFCLPTFFAKILALQSPDGNLLLTTSLKSAKLAVDLSRFKHLDNLREASGLWATS